MTDIEDVQLESLELGAVPIVRTFVERLELDQLLESYVPRRRLGREPKISTGRVISVLIANILVSRRPLYALRDWMQGYVPDPFHLEKDEVNLLNDDRIGRALDHLYEADRASLMTSVVTRAIKIFEIDLKQLHNDTTTITFSGAYENQKDKNDRVHPPLITFGKNKDHRPDMKQLVYSLTVSADGAVPIHHKTYDGNKTDDKIHIETWSILRDLVGSPDFLYVADSKLCTRENMEYIASQGGSFITVLPRTRGEYEDFRSQLRSGEVIEWEEIIRKENPRGKEKDEVVYKAFEGKPSSEGYRIIWYRSSQKIALDEKVRRSKIAKAEKRIETLQNRTGKHQFKTEETALEAAQEVLKATGVERWLDVTVGTHIGYDYKQTTPGRPGKDTQYTREEFPFILINVEENAENIQADALCDGIFPLITNGKVENLSPEEVLAKYKYQPFLEKRNEQLKSVYHVTPILAHNPERVSSLLFIYYLALLLWSLIEREIRRKMKDHNIASLPIYPEMRECTAPTTDGVFQTIQGIRRHRLMDENDNVIKTFYDDLSPVAIESLELLGVDLGYYGIHLGNKK